MMVHWEKELGNKKSGHLTKMVYLRISSAEMVQDLKVFGVVPCKSESGRVPRWINKHCYADFFFRGLFDGDGCVGVRRGSYRAGRTYITFGGNTRIVNSFRSWVERKTGYRGGLSIRKNGFRVINYSYGAVPRVGVCLYGDERGIRLIRKASMCGVKGI